MPYNTEYIHLSGVVVLKSHVPDEKVELLEELLEDIANYEFQENENAVVCEIYTNENGKYWVDDVKYSLESIENELKEYLESAKFTYESQDGGVDIPHWRFLWDPKEKRFKYQEGVITYIDKKLPE